MMGKRQNVKNIVPLASFKLRTLNSDLKTLNLGTKFDSAGFDLQILYFLSKSVSVDSQKFRSSDLDIIDPFQG